MKNFFKHLIGFLFIYAPIRAIIEVTTGGTITNLLTLQQLVGAVISALLVAGFMAYQNKNK